MKLKARMARDIACMGVAMVIPFAVMAANWEPSGVSVEPVVIAWEDLDSAERHTDEAVAYTAIAHTPVESSYTLHDLEYLALVIYQEAGADTCSDELRQMVGEVVLNRVDSTDFPDTISDVLLQPWQYGRLAFAGLVWPERAAMPQEAHAVARAYEIAEALLNGSAERILPTDAVYQAEFPQGSETLAYAGGIYFCK